MKFLVLLLTSFSLSAQASLYSEFSRVHASEVDCLESTPSPIVCQVLQNNLMLCRSEFEALMKNSGVRKLNISIYEKIRRDSSMVRPLTDKINEYAAKSTAVKMVKEKLKNLHQCG